MSNGVIMKEDDRLQVYIHLLEYLKEDRRMNLIVHLPLNGMCLLLRKIIWDYSWYRPCYFSDIRNYPELMRYIPFDKSINTHWFELNPESTTRIEIVEQIIKEMKEKIKI